MRTMANRFSRGVVVIVVLLPLLRKRNIAGIDLVLLQPLVPAKTFIIIMFVLDKLLFISLQR